MQQILRSKKGLTLIELIVVMLILVILAAILVPTLTGYIDRTNDKVIRIEARSAYIACQAIVAEEYGANPTSFDGSGLEIDDETGFDNATYNTMFTELSELDVSNVTALTVNNSGIIISFVYTNGKYTATYTGPVKAADGTTTPGSWDYQPVTE